MKISVVIPAYNEEKYIDKCLESLNAQSTPPDEIIVVDNNSSDNTSLVAKKYKVRVISEKKPGITPARNTGFNTASHEIIARIDADSIAPYDWIQKIKEAFLSEDIEAVSGISYFYDAYFPAITTKIQTFMYFKISKLLLGHDIVQGPNLALKKSAWMKVQDECCELDTDIHEDIDLAMHIAKYGTIVFDPDLVTYVSARRINHNMESIVTDYLPKWIRTMYFYDHVLHCEPGASTKMKKIIKHQMVLVHRILKYFSQK